MPNSLTRFAFALLVSAQTMTTYGQEPGLGIQILGISAAEGELPPGAAERMAEGAASFSFGSSSGGFSMGSMLGGVNPNDRSQLFGLLGNESVRKELQLTSEQYEGVQSVMKKSQQNMQAMVKDIVSQSNGGAIRLDGNSLKDIMAENQKQAEAAVEEILLPQQLARVRQLAYQVEVANQGLGECLVNGRLGKEIGVYDDQKQHLTDVAARIDVETRAAIAKIKAEARLRLLAELSPEQRKAAEELLGDYFDYEAVSLEKQLQKSMQAMRSKQVEADTEEESKSRRRSNR